MNRAARALAIDVTVVCEAFLRQPEAIVYKRGELAVLFSSAHRVRSNYITAFAQPVSEAANPKTGAIEARDGT